MHKVSRMSMGGRIGARRWRTGSGRMSGRRRRGTPNGTVREAAGKIGTWGVEV
jgi:hypothetical protein